MQAESPQEPLRLVEAGDRAAAMEIVGELAVDAMSKLYALAAGGPPLVARAYHEEDALLLLLRFDPSHLSNTGDPGSPLSEAALMALPDMIASAVRNASEAHHRLIPGSLTISSDRGVVSLGFSVALAVEEQPAATGELDDWPTPRLALVS
ncbi:MAG TPA: hypothetical protein VL977_05185 [Solirubrobacteraceae bacterium]|nr:hypothetical protein [Solirubrobacteraceae bacterium]